MKTSELTGAALDWAVAKAWQHVYSDRHILEYATKKGYSPSTDWAQAGPIIAREDIEFVLAKEGGHHESAKWMAVIRNSWFGFGEEHLIAAMRCYVASKLGDEVDVPEELI